MIVIVIVTVPMAVVVAGGGVVWVGGTLKVGVVLGAMLPTIN